MQCETQVSGIAATFMQSDCGLPVTLDTNGIYGSFHRYTVESILYTEHTMGLTQEWLGYLEIIIVTVGYHAA